MPVDHLRYDILAQAALRGMVRGLLADVAKKGLPGEHHFYVTFDTHADGVRISPRLLEQYPEQMTVVLQHQFWDLKVTDEIFEVGLSFGGVAEKLVIPFAAITAFVDPSVQFALQFETVEEGEEEAGSPRKPKAPPAGMTVPASEGKTRPPARSAAPKPAEAPAAKNADEPAKPDDKPAGAEVVRLDRFRKK